MSMVHIGCDTDMSCIFYMSPASMASSRESILLAFLWGAGAGAGADAGDIAAVSQWDACTAAGMLPGSSRSVAAAVILCCRCHVAESVFGSENSVDITSCELPLESSLGRGGLLACVS